MEQNTNIFSNFYNNYLEVEAEFSKIHANFLKKTFICEKNYNQYHLLNEHPIQFEAREIHSGICPVRSTNLTLFIKKVYTMIELGNFQCILCGQEITNVQSIDEIFIHYDQAHRDYESSRQKCTMSQNGVSNRYYFLTGNTCLHLNNFVYKFVHTSYNQSYL